MVMLLPRRSNAGIAFYDRRFAVIFKRIESVVNWS